VNEAKDATPDAKRPLKKPKLFYKVSTAVSVQYPVLLRVLLHIFPHASNAGVVIFSSALLGRIVSRSTKTTSRLVTQMIELKLIKIFDPALGKNIFSINSNAITTMNSKDLWRSAFNSKIEPPSSFNGKDKPEFFKVDANSIEAMLLLPENTFAFLMKMAVEMNQQNGILTKEYAKKLIGKDSFYGALADLETKKLINVDGEKIALNDRCITSRPLLENKSVYSESLFPKNGKTYSVAFAGIPVIRTTTQRPRPTHGVSKKPSHSVAAAAQPD